LRAGLAGRFRPVETGYRRRDRRCHTTGGAGGTALHPRIVAGRQGARAMGRWGGGRCRVDAEIHRSGTRSRFTTQTRMNLM
jgi:hypothetical protein